MGKFFFRAGEFACGVDECCAHRGRYEPRAGAKNDGTVVAWGSNANGQTNVPAGLSNVVDIAAGIQHSMALMSNGTVVAWGGNSYEQTNVPAGLTNVIAIAAGGYHNLALTANNTVTAWGNNTQGQTTVPAGLSNVVAVAGGFNTALLYSPMELWRPGDGMYLDNEHTCRPGERDCHCCG